MEANAQIQAFEFLGFHFIQMLTFKMRVIFQAAPTIDKRKVFFIKKTISCQFKLLLLTHKATTATATAAAVTYAYKPLFLRNHQIQ